MATSLLAAVCAGLIGLGVIAYAVLGGADYGGGVWDLLASGPLAERQRASIAHAIGPVWEANNVWLIYVITVTWTTFPVVYAAVSTALFVPVLLALMGIILRGAAFGFRSQYAARAGVAVTWSSIFSGASTITPFLLGTIAGAIAGGALHVHNGAAAVSGGSYWTLWTTPFALACGAFAVALCAVLAATYLAVEAETAHDLALADIFRAKALVSGAITALIGALAAILAHFQSPVLWQGLVGKALPLSLGAVVIGLATAAALLLGFLRLARLGVAAETACILAAWAVAQYPYLIIPDVTIASAAVPRSVLIAVTIASVAGMLVLLPSLWYLFRVFKGQAGKPAGPTAALRAEEGWRAAFGEDPAREESTAASGSDPHHD
jgi:cytochrome bd ubiquinol oxidase subunit II